MLSVDLECGNKHRFEGQFKDYSNYREQLEMKMIQCPICGSPEITRLYTGCSFQARPSARTEAEKKLGAAGEFIRSFNTFIKSNFEDVGRDFTDQARAIHYGLEEPKNIYGETTPGELKELVEEGIEIFPLLETKDTSH